MVLETAENVNNGNPSPLEALLAGAEGFPPMLDIPPDADDETMVELAIALSLQQDQQGRRQCQEQRPVGPALERGFGSYWCAADVACPQFWGEVDLGESCSETQVESERDCGGIFRLGASHIASGGFAFGTISSQIC